MAEYPPYVNAYGSIPKLFNAIKAAAVPPKFTSDFLSTVLDLKSSSYRAMIPLLKRLGFIDPSNVPTQAYKDFREDSLSGVVMAERIKDAYKALFQANEYAWKLDKPALTAKLKSVTGLAEDDQILAALVGTFMALSALAKWGAEAPKKSEPKIKDGVEESGERAKVDANREEERQTAPLRLSYTINLNLPATTEIEVFNAIFKSLRENLLKEI
ncbi:MAG TPA: DUF5343 domain-containing protein [Terracidiphilus sp.]|nr:DUF5343 domain-containing protein [Terracidiphilus sp.]